MKHILFKTAIVFGIVCYSTGAFSQKSNISDFWEVSQKVEDILPYNYSESMELLNDLYNIADLYPENSNYYTTCLYLESLINYNNFKYDSLLINKLNDHLTYLQHYEGSSLFNIALTEYAIAVNNIVLNEFLDSFFAAMHALENFKIENNTYYIAKTLNLLGNISNQIHSHHLANDYFVEALSYLTPTDNLYYRVKCNLYMANSFLQNYPLSLVDSLLSLVEPIKTGNHPSSLLHLYANLSGIYSFLGQYEKSFKYLKIIAALLDENPEINNKYFYYNLNYNTAYYYNQLSMHDSALYYFEKTYDIALILNNQNLSSSCLLEISNIYSGLDQKDSAYYYLTKYVELQDNINNRAKMFETYRTYINAIINYSKKELKIKEKELYMRNIGLIISIIAVIISMLLMIMLLIIIKQKKNKQQLLKESLDSKVREITSYSMLLSNKNNLLVNIMDNVNELTSNDNNKTRIEEINNLIKNNLHTDLDWETFVMHFEKVHPNFFKNLKKKCDDLTTTNLRFCAYIRIGLSTKEIATIQNIATTSVKVARFRLKKKFGLNENDSLDEFITRM
ncbi:hypothetical protein LJC73_06570 [Bacteroidales bacterium OttesenSCG-928-L14]|nr:hypothetical protein [Bacteroidales bacterium OttesenSCG-928-L14]